MIEMYLKYDNMQTFGIINAFICINNHVNSCINSMLSGIDFMGPFLPSKGKEYVLVAVDYVSKWVEAIPIRTNDYRVVNKFIASKIFSRFSCPRAIISDNGSHFTNSHFRSLVRKYGVHHRVTTPYHPQANDQVQVSNREVKNIL